MRDTVCYIGKLFGHRLVIVVEYCLFQNFGMEFGNAVDGMRTDNAQISHSYLSVCDNSHAGNSVPISGIEIPHISAETAVNLFDYHIKARKTKFENILVPAFKRFGHNRMVCIRNGLFHNVPRIFPRIRINIHEYTHKFGNADRRVRVVDMDSDLFTEIAERAVHGKMIRDYALKRRGNKEILLAQTQHFALGRCVCGIKNL